MRIPGDLDDWVEALRKTERGRGVLANVQSEENVPEEISDAVFRRVATIFNPGNDPSAAFLQALEEIVESALAGPKARLGLDILTRFTSLSRIADQDEARRRGYSESMLLADPNRLQKLRRIRLGRPPRQIVWAALSDPIERDLLAGATISRILDRLGLFRRLEQPMVQITYSANDPPPPIAVPTTFDAGADPRFQPAPKGAPHGTTSPVSMPDDGFPEYVHPGFDVEDPGLKLHTPPATTK